MRRWGWVWTATILLLCIGNQILVHSAVTGAQPALLRFALTLFPLLILACWALTRPRIKPVWILVLLAAGAATYVLASRDGWGLAAAYGIPHAAVYLGLLWLFGLTLLFGQEPLITRLARRVHGLLQPDHEAYTRRLTAVWCVFFAAQLVASALLSRFASPASWSFFVNLLNFPLLALMFVGEYGYRVIRYPDFPRTSIPMAIEAFVRDAARAGSANVR